MHHPKDVFENPENYLAFLTSKDFEGQFFDRKDTPLNYTKSTGNDLKDTIKKTISAFANYNYDGGLIAVGINDKTQFITGTNHLTEEQINSLTNSTASTELRNHATQIKSFDLQNTDNQVVTIYLFYTHHTDNAICETTEANPRAWKRTGSQCLLLSEQDKLQLLRDKRVIDWEKMVIDVEFDVNYLDSTTIRLFKQGYLKNASEESFNLSIKDILVQIGAIRNQKGLWYWTNAGFLLFDLSPQRMIPQAHLRFLRYDYLIEENPHISLTSYDETFSYGSLPTLLNRIRKFAQSPFFKHFTVRNADGHLENFDQFPKDALEEAIINAIMHRDYAVNTPIYCKLYRDAFVVENAGRILQPDRQMPENFTLETETLLPNARNRLLVEWTKLLTDEDGKPFVRGISEGTRKMKDLMQKMYFPYPKYKTNGKTAVTLQSVATPEEFEEQIRKHKEHNTINISILHAESYENALENLEKLIANKDNEIEKLQLSYSLALDKSPNFEAAKVLYEKMKKQNIPLDKFSYNILINKSHTFEQAERFFAEMKAANLKPNEISYSTLINKSQTFEQAENLFKEMKAANLKLDEISYSTLINKSQTFEQAESLFKEMKAANLKLDEISYSTLINKSQTFEQAESFFAEMKAANLKLDEISYNTLINKGETFKQQLPYYQEIIKKFPFRKGNFKSEKSYNFLFFALFKKIEKEKNKDAWAFIKAEIFRLGVTLDEKYHDRAKNFYDNLENKFD
jgi:predicted HTH transcriptional regulator/uncharacterized protein YciU (UPF0263 family)